MIHTHHHDSDSALDGVGTASQCARIVAGMGHVALAQTNHGSANGALKHRKACEREGVIPICGVETYWRPDHRVRDKEWRYRRWHLVLLAKNLAGWHNLIRLTSTAFSEGFYQDPCVSWETQEKFSEGMICTTSCALGPLPYLIENGTQRDVDEWAERSLKIYGDNLYFSIMPHDWDRQRALNLEIVSIANRHGCPILYEGDSHYPEPGWEETQKIAVLAGWGKTFDEAEAENRKRIAEGKDVYELWHPDLHIMAEDEVRDRFARFHPDLSPSVVDEAISNTDLLAASVEPYLMDRSLKMPRSAGGDPRRAIERWCDESMVRLGLVGSTAHEEKLAEEYGVIDARGAWPYFQLVAGFVRWAKSDEPLPPTADDPHPARKKPIRLNTRGSAAASLVCYLTGISTLDPIAHKFKFERFMNPERPSLPDVDLDVASSGREMLKEFARRTYGDECVADVVAQQHFQPRAALQTVARTMYGYASTAFGEVAILTHESTGCIDAVHDRDLEALREREPRLNEWSQRWPEAWIHAVRLENAGDPSVSRLSKHAAAVVILPGPVTDYMPTIKASEDELGVRTAWGETSKVSIVDEIGVVKVDFLGLAGMDQQQMIVDTILESTGERIDLDDLPAMRDPYAVEEVVMDVFRGGFNLGVNQFSGEGVTDFMVRCHPNDVVDLTTINAIYRPGSIGSGGHNRYAKRKSGTDLVEIHPALQEILGDTYGVLVYQEQVMEIFRAICGYSLGQADDIRKEIDKLNRAKNQAGREKLLARHEEFIAGATSVLGSTEAAEQLWQGILPFTSYAFNRPHAGSYSAQAYQDAWLKAHYPLDFYSALLTMEGKKTFLILREGKNFGITIMPPDVNVSGVGFTVDREAKALRYGLRGIKGIGDAAADQIMRDRPFMSLSDFDTRCSVKYSKVNKASREKLIRGGALDSLGARDDWKATDRAKAEVELLGVALEPGGLLGDDAPLVREHVYSEQEVAACADGASVVVGGSVVDIRRVTTKRGRSVGQQMAFIKLSLELDGYSITCFSDVWAKIQPIIDSGDMVLVKGRKDDRGSIIAKDAILLGDFIADMTAAPA